MRTIPERCQHLTGFLPRRVPTKTASGAWRVSPHGSKTPSHWIPLKLFVAAACCS